MNILITSIGSNTAISVVKAIRGLPQPIKIIGTDTNTISECAGAHFVDLFYQISYASDKELFEKEIITIIKKESIDCVIPIHDKEIEIISIMSEKWPSLTFWAVNNENVIKICNNKRVANNLFLNNGINVPNVYDLMEEIDSFPVIIKPIAGVSSKGIKIIKNKEELTPIDKTQDLLIQQYITGTEYTVDCFSNYDGVFYGGLARERLETKEGMSTKGVTRKIDSLIEYSKKIHEILNYKGASNIQFIISENKVYFIEINPRFSGAGILSYKANFNSPYFTILQALKKELPTFSDLHIKYDLKMVRYWEEHFYEKENIIV
ncbi:ATP-grasp domain-containing protein [Chitinophagaceae bacterium LWZ2-11]